MNSRIRVILYAMMIVLIALASAFSVVPARADDGAPPPPAAPAAPAAHSQAPAGTNVVVVNSDGHKVSLASQQAADIVASGDPIWCPTGVAPRPGLGGCTFTQTSINLGLLSVLPTPLSLVRNGTIWIESGYTGTTLLEGGPVILNNGLLGTTVNHALTITGGWNGLSNGRLDPLHPYSTFNVPLTINWNAAVTLNNLMITGAAGDGLTVTSPGAIVLNNIDSISNTGNGASLDNCRFNGAICTGAGTISVNYSTFNNNGNNGLQVLSARTISGKNLTAVFNAGDGVLLDNYINFCTNCTGQPVTLTSINNFNYNGADGFDVFSRGTITVGNITAFNNANQGVTLDNCIYNGGLAICNNGTLANHITKVGYNVTVRGYNNVSDNGASGLTVYATGVITVSNLTSNNNGTLGSSLFGYGAYLNNFGATLKLKNITVNGFNSFSENGLTGLWLDSKGVVTLSNVTASHNGLTNACGTGDNCNGLALADSAGLTLAGYGTFNNNTDYGMQVLNTTGAIKLTNLYMYHNAGYGAFLNNCGGNPAACIGHGSVTLSGRNAFISNGKTGLSILSYGVVTLSNITASYNGTALLTSGSGVFVENCLFDGVNTCYTSTPRAVVLTGLNTFNNNNVNGLTVYTQGPITASNVTADDNNIYGANLKNQWWYKTYNITLTGLNNFANNLGEDGLSVYASGAFVASNIDSYNNTSGNGITASTVTSITLTCGNIFSNGGYGLNLSSVLLKTITLKAVYSGLNLIEPDHFSTTPIVYRACPVP